MKRPLFLLLCLSLLAAATAQTNQQDDEENDITVLADFGFANIIPGERLTPVTLVVQAQDENITGTVEVAFSSGPGESGRIITPVDVAAGSEGIFRVVVPIPDVMPRVVLTLRDREGRRLAETVYTILPDATEVPLPEIIDPGEELLISATPRMSAARTSKALAEGLISVLPENERLDGQDRQWRLPNLNLDRAQVHLLRHLVGADVLLDALPLSQHAYEGVFAVIVDRETVRRAGPRAILTLQRWVLGGGRLVVLADTPGREWIEFLPSAAPVGAITLEPQQEFTPTGELSNVTGHPGATFIGRPVTLAIAAQDAGWTTRWKSGEETYLAEGPVGFGWITILGVHPDTISGNLGEDAWRVWANALHTPANAAYIAGGAERTIRSRDRYWYATNVLTNLPVQVFDAIGRTPTFFGPAILLVTAVTITLALALGPVDFFLLKKLRLRHLSWLSALLWIALAAAVGIVMPDQLRASATHISRHTLIDALLPNQALVGTAHSDLNERFESIPPNLRAWALGFTNIFAGSAGAIEFEPISDGRYWREYAIPGSRATIARSLTSRQEPSSGGLDAVRSTQPLSVRPGIWSTKVFTDTGPTTPKVSVALERTDTGWRLRLAGTDAQSIIEGQLCISGTLSSTRSDRTYFEIPPTQLAAEGDFVYEFDDKDASPRPRGSYLRSTGDALHMELSRQIPSARAGGSLNPKYLLMLPGPSERTAAIEALANSPDCALIELSVQGQPLDTPIATPGIESEQSTMYRIVTPIHGDPNRD